MSMHRRELTRLRIRLQKVALDLEAIEAEADRPREPVDIPDPIRIELENTIRDLQIASDRPPRG